ncbi:MAG: OmpA family protein, partial [Cocleimonas sp.]
MKNKTTTYKWAYLPFVFSSAAILATQATAGPSGSQRYQDAKQVNSINHEYVGGDHSIGFGVDDEGNVDAQFDAAISRSDEHRTGVGLWAGYDLTGDNQGVLGRGGQVNHAWVSKDASGQVTHVNKTFAAYDRNEVGHDKATVGYGQENENLFWDGRVSKGLSGGKDKRTVGTTVVTDRAYDWGVGATVGKFLPGANARIRAGIDHEWSNKVGSGESNARNTTLSAGIEKFFQGTGHSLSLDVAGSKNSGGYRFANDDDTDVTGRLGYKYDFGGASIYQPDRRYRRVRVEVPGKSVPAYKTVPVYAKKTIRTPYKQLVKSTMELEGQTFFKLNSSKLIPSAQTRLKQIAGQIRKTGYKGSIRITGNTCGLGDARYDQILSEKRAKEVRNFLIKNGFNPNHLIARGLGKGHPKYDRTPDQDFKNRRVDIEYVSEKQAYKTGYKTEQKTVQTGTRKVQLPGAPGAPRVIWKTEAIPTSPAWIQRALNNNIKHDRNVNTYTT